MNNMNDNIIYSYTRQDAIDDGTIIDVSEVAKKNGFTVPVAVTRTIFEKYIRQEEEAKTDTKLHALLLFLCQKILTEAKPSDGNLFCTKVNLENKLTDVWLGIEATSPTDSSPAMTIMLPEDY